MIEVGLLSLEEKVGQMFMCGFDGKVPMAEIITMIEKHRIGGIIYFRRNVQDTKQLSRMSLELQQINAVHSAVPLFLAIDQEGGMVSRIDREVTLIPGAMALGATRNKDAAWKTAAISGRELRGMGINMNFAPSVDVNNNPQNPVIGVRSYGADPILVGEMGAAAVRGYQEAGVAATAKHFPGHGDTDVDSHLGVPIVRHETERLERIELSPFIRVIEAGVDAIMTAHIIFPAFGEEKRPATLSPNILMGLLRGRLGFSGVIVTDCLEMHAISKEYGIPQAAVMAIEAGADLVLVSHTYEEQQAAVVAVMEAVRSGRIPESRIDESVERILALKKKRNMEGFIGGMGEAFGLAQDWDLVREVSEQSITLVKDEGGLPLDPDEPTLIVWAEPREASEVVEIIHQEEALESALSPFLKKVEEIRIGLKPMEDEIVLVLGRGSQFKQIVVATHNPVSRLDQGQIQLVKKLASLTGIRLVVAATRNPYDLNEFPEVKTYLCTYENRPMAIQSLARVLMGKTRPQGKLPVTLSETYGFGWGMTTFHSAERSQK
ncbi:beta-N-acetylhexosaminidase [Paenibacillus sp. GP183]|uniref:beta-N-acetylhexosaminidase n=1 Tax=Paenibacillus sp. GP183 TaxID=1882751 RepID=UPI00089C218E|nr:beta-N-acetylhexosaminidase [Paenibacillus sp. GP183]SEC67413.1 beta-N-acetylhexosaminidase [Paenibacillus sp. GP183]